MYILYDDYHGVCVLSLCNPYLDPCIGAHQAPLSMELLRQEYWSGLPFPNLGDLPNLGTRPSTPVSAALARGFFNTPQPGKPEYQSKLVSIIAVVVLLLCHVQLFVTPMDCSMPGFPAFQLFFPVLPELAQTYVHQVGDVIQPSRPLSFSSPTAFNSFPASGSFHMSWLFASGSQSIGASTSASVLPMNIQG